MFLAHTHTHTPTYHSQLRGLHISLSEIFPPHQFSATTNHIFSATTKHIFSATTKQRFQTEMSTPKAWTNKREGGWMHNKNSYGRLHNLSLVLTKFLKQNYDRLTLAIKILKRPRKSSFFGAGTYRARFFQKCPKCFAILLTCFSVLKGFLSL